jgi:hypothetical protein
LKKQRNDAAEESLPSNQRVPLEEQSRRPLTRLKAGAEHYELAAIQKNFAPDIADKAQTYTHPNQPQKGACFF